MDNIELIILRDFMSEGEMIMYLLQDGHILCCEESAIIDNQIITQKASDLGYDVMINNNNEFEFRIKKNQLNN